MLVGDRGAPPGSQDRHAGIDGTTVRTASCETGGPHPVRRRPCRDGRHIPGLRRLLPTTEDSPRDRERGSRLLCAPLDATVGTPPSPSDESCGLRGGKHPDRIYACQCHLHLVRAVKAAPPARTTTRSSSNVVGRRRTL